jgi:predicted metalloprotease with PDZ domain
LQESSFDAWIKLYRPDANSRNAQISYYLKGELVAFLLDLRIRDRHDNCRSFDDVLRLLWQKFGQPGVGFSPKELEEVIETVAECDLQPFFRHYLETTAELPFDEYLHPFGLRLVNEANGVPYLGLTLKSERGVDLIQWVEDDSPAQHAGLDAGDELLAIDGLRVTTETLGDRLRDYQPGETLAIAFFHLDELRSTTVTLAAPQPSTYQIVPVEMPTVEQTHKLLGWLGTF